MPTTTYPSISDVLRCGPAVAYTHRHTATGYPIAYKVVMGGLMVTTSPYDGRSRVLRNEGGIFLPVIAGRTR